MSERSFERRATPGVKETHMFVVNSLLRRVILFLLHLALLVALWTTALARLSDRPTAIPLLTSVGTQLVNPAITSAGKGVDRARYQQLEAQAQASPSAQLSVPGLKTTVRGSEILGLSYDAGTKVIYGKVADAYYTGGVSAAFDVPALPSGFSRVFTDYGALASYATQHGLPVSLPALPVDLLNLAGHIGLSPNTLTASEHQTIAQFALVAWLVSLLLAALLMLVSRRGGRISSVAWAVFNAALPGVILIGAAVLALSRGVGPVKTLADMPGIIGGAFIPVYVGAAVAGLVGAIVAFIFRLTVHGRKKKPAYVAQPATPPLMPMRTPAYRPGGPQYPSVPYPEPSAPTDPNADTQPF
jgi:hypothetical protein